MTVSMINDWVYVHRKYLLAIFVLIGFFFRIYHLQQVGLSEDEVNKVNAIHSYLNGDFTPNAEHPMLMKSLILVSMVGADSYNHYVAGPMGWTTIGPETATRFPNVVFGALTAIVLYLLVMAFFDWRKGLIAAFLWSTGINAIFVNRIAKEDTLLVFFILLGFYFHRRMKTTPDSEPQLKRRFYFLSAASFGLMLASKYFPHYLGLNALYYILHRKVQPEGYPPDRYNWKNLVQYLVVLIQVFLLFNPMVLNPQVLHHLVNYTELKTVTHHGYYMQDTLYHNNVDKTPLNGTPWYFYLLYLLVKVPVPLLLLFAVGIVWCIRHWRDPGPFFVLFWLVFWLVPYSFFGVKFLRYTLSLTPALYIGAACGVDVIYVRIRELFAHVRFRFQPVTASLIIPVFLLVQPVSALMTTLPFYSTYVNTIGGGDSRIGYFFPHDEYYDLYLREAIRKTLALAPDGSVFAGETPAVFNYYLQRYHRPDIQVVNLSDSTFPIDDDQPVFLFLQPGRRYFENIEFYRHFWNRGHPVVDISLHDIPVVKVYRWDGKDFLDLAARRAFFEAADH